jgi:hypothetical protein
MHELYYRLFQWIEYHQIPDMMQHHKSRKEPWIIDGHILAYFQRALQQMAVSSSILKQGRLHQVSLCNPWLFDIEMLILRGSILDPILYYSI